MVHLFFIKVYRWAIACLIAVGLFYLGLYLAYGIKLYYAVEVGYSCGIVGAAHASALFWIVLGDDALEKCSYLWALYFDNRFTLWIDGEERATYNSSEYFSTVLAEINALESVHWTELSESERQARLICFGSASPRKVRVYYNDVRGSRSWLKKVR